MSQLFSDDFETGDYSKWDNVVGSQGSQITQSLVHAGQFASRTSGEGYYEGNLVKRTFGSFTELWMTAYVLFPSTYIFDGNNGLHMWRLSDEGLGSFQLDFGPNQSGNIQISHFKGDTDGTTLSNTVGWKPYEGDRGDRWVLWEVHSRLNDLGQSNGLIEFFADGVLVNSLSGDFRGTTDAQYNYAAFASNVAGDDATWASTNWWYMDDVVLSTTRISAVDTTPPAIPEAPTIVDIRSVQGLVFPFSPGDRVRTLNQLTVRSGFELTSSSLGSQPTGALGTVVDVVDWMGRFRVDINFDSGPDGWVTGGTHDGINVTSTTLEVI